MRKTPARAGARLVKSDLCNLFTAIAKAFKHVRHGCRLAVRDFSGIFQGKPKEGSMAEITSANAWANNEVASESARFKQHSDEPARLPPGTVCGNWFRCNRASA